MFTPEVCGNKYGILKNEKKKKNQYTNIFKKIAASSCLPNT